MQPILENIQCLMYSTYQMWPILVFADTECTVITNNIFQYDKLIYLNGQRKTYAPEIANIAKYAYLYSFISA